MAKGHSLKRASLSFTEQAVEEAGPSRTMDKQSLKEQ